LTFNCNFPCLTCASRQEPSTCLSCNTVEGNNILYEKKCYETCPKGTYFEYFSCKPCDKQCKTCYKDSGLMCTSCNANSEWPYLSGNICTKDCDFGYFGNVLTGLCEKCSYPCESCSGTADTCLSCN
jgi:proprotein convertase subtilisin/kexin type 5